MAIISKDNFEKVVKTITQNKISNIDFLYDVFELSYESIDDLIANNVVSTTNSINQLGLINYVLGEYTYSIANRNEEEINDFVKNEKVVIQMASIVADKYMTNDFFSYKEKTLGNRFLPPISSLDTYLNFMLNILSRYNKNDPKSTLIVDLLTKSVSIARCVLELLCKGFETEAMASWRTLHECECTLILLDNQKDELIQLYLKHMNYAIAYRGGIPSKEETDKVFEELKGEMRLHDLKSKDMKKFIEYGWLYGVNNPDNIDFKLNFRDGLETLAGLHRYSKVYEQSSEIVHSTPMLIYSNKVYYYLMTLLNTYESFFRIERVFASLFLSQNPASIQERYKTMRNVYYSQLLSIYKNEQARFISLAKRKKVEQ